MFFHVDEAGNTGLNLFDPNQRYLSYGLLSSKLNVDVLGEAIHQEMLEILGVEVLHASQIGNDGISKICMQLLALQKKHKFRFDYYFIDKPTYALTMLFDAVFDAGLNEAVKWDLYWTPLRFVVIHNLSLLIDEDLLKESWELCITTNVAREKERISALLCDLKRRTIDSTLDARSKELLVDAFDFGIARPLDLDFGFTGAKHVSPNAVGFQFVVYAIARRSRAQSGRGPNLIRIDQQHQFNGAQIGTHYNLSRIAQGIRSVSASERRRYLNHPLFHDVPDSELMLEGLPPEGLEISKSRDSIGLQIVDLYLWIMNRLTLQKELPASVAAVAQGFLRTAVVDGVSLEGMAQRWNAFERKLPALEALTESEVQLARQSIEQHRAKVESLRGTY